MKNGPASERNEASTEASDGKHAPGDTVGERTHSHTERETIARAPSAVTLLPRPGVGGSVRWLIPFAGWCVALALAMLALLRIFFHDGTLLLTCINAFSLYAYLPIYPVFAWATWRRRWWLTSICGFVMVCHVAWVAPDFMPAREYQSSGAPDLATREIVIFCGNIAAHNDQRERYLDEIVAVDADIVVLVEYRRWWHSVVMGSALPKIYKYGTGISVPYLGEIAVFSKLPIKHIQRHWPTGRQICVVEVEAGGETLRLFCVHGPRPMNTPGNNYVDFWKEAFPLFAQQSGPMILLGDFNATQHSALYEQITSRGLRSAHVDRGRGWAVSWPNGEAPAPPIRIDHAFLSRDVECSMVSEGEGAGSDHKPILLRVRIAGHQEGAHEKALGEE